MLLSNPLLSNLRLRAALGRVLALYCYTVTAGFYLVSFLTDSWRMYVAANWAGISIKDLSIDHWSEVAINSEFQLVCEGAQLGTETRSIWNCLNSLTI